MEGGDSGRGLEPVKVFCRFAPPAGTREVVSHALQQLPGGCVRVAVADRYSGTGVEVDCERAFDAGATQSEVYESVTQPLVTQLVSGYNVTLLAFGQTASGKTHTMLGPQGGRIEFLRSAEHRGLVPRTIEAVFAEARRKLPHTTRIDLAFFEVYNEVVSDLVAKATAPDPVSQNQNFSYKGTAKHKFDRDINRVSVSRAEECLHILEATLTARQQAGTDLNDASSRGHSVVQLRIHGPGWRSTMSLVDLAGSESVKKSGAQGTRRLETKRINTSLLALKQVIHALQRKKDHVPYGDSLLTRVLADSLGGNSFLHFLVCCTSREEDTQETMQTLRTAREASSVVRRSPGLSRAPAADGAEVKPWVAGLETDGELTREADALRKRNEFLEGQCTRLQQQVLQLHETNSQLVGQLGERQSTYTNHLSAAQQQVAERQKELEGAKAELSLTRSDAERRRVHSEMLSAKLSDAQRRMDVIANQIQRVTRENEQLRADNEMLRCGQRRCDPVEGFASDAASTATARSTSDCPPTPNGTMGGSPAVWAKQPTPSNSQRWPTAFNRPAGTCPGQHLSGAGQHLNGAGQHLNGAGQQLNVSAVLSESSKFLEDLRRLRPQEPPTLDAGTRHGLLTDAVRERVERLEAALLCPGAP